MSYWDPMVTSGKSWETMGSRWIFRHSWIPRNSYGTPLGYCGIPMGLIAPWGAKKGQTHAEFFNCQLRYSVRLTLLPTDKAILLLVQLNAGDDGNNMCSGVTNRPRRLPLNLTDGSTKRTAVIPRPPNKLSLNHVGQKLPSYYFLAINSLSI